MKTRNMGGSGTRRSDISCFFKFLFGMVAVVGFILVLLVGTLDSTTTQGGGLGSTETTTTTSSSTTEFSGRDHQKLVNPELDLNYMSKRRVPNGPDPIHNRYVCKYMSAYNYSSFCV
jgi:hypothetical protein